jgi:hypothetical protein
VGVLDGEALRTLQKAGVYDRAAADMILGAGAQWASRHGQGGAISSALQASVAATAT